MVDNIEYAATIFSNGRLCSKGTEYRADNHYCYPGINCKFWKNDNSFRNFEQLINKYKIDHSIFRKNAKLTYSIQNKKKYTIRNKFIRKVIDTSGAGDGFNAAYVSNFIIHNDPALALKEASLLGSKIIMQKGAIVDVK